MEIRCNRCKEKIEGEYYTHVYDEEPFYCSEGCLYNKGFLYKLYWKVIKSLKKHVFKSWTYG